jgi:GNAT superfamily N-acetyltransferase
MSASGGSTPRKGFGQTTSESAKAHPGEQVEVRPVRSQRELMRFIKLPWRLYGPESQWVPPLISERKRFLDQRKNAFFKHATAEYFIAYRRRQPVGRISAHVDHWFNEFQQNSWGLFGFFECEDSQETADALFETAESWLREQGRDLMIGPMDFTTNHECGLLVAGHEHPPQILEPWQHPYYKTLFEGYGFAKAMDLLKWRLDVSDRSKVLPVVSEQAKRLEPEHGITVRHMRRSELKREVERFKEVYNAAWARNWGFVPLTDEEIDDQARELKPLLDENWAFIAERGDETVGASLTLPDYNQVLKRLNGRLLPFGWLKFLRARKTIDAVRVFALGVKPEYQHTGVASAFYIECFDMAATTPQRGGEMGWILENNTAMNRGMEALGGEVTKRYRLYEKQLA